MKPTLLASVRKQIHAETCERMVKRFPKDEAMLRAYYANLIELTTEDHDPLVQGWHATVERSEDAKPVEVQRELALPPLTAADEHYYDDEPAEEIDPFS